MINDLVVKRDGSKVPYDIEKIGIAISGAFQECGTELSDEWLIKCIDAEARRLEEPTVEQIQDIVETYLMKLGYLEEAKAYIKYRHTHELARQNLLNEQVGKKLRAEQIDNQNANVDEYSFGGRIGEASDVVLKEYALEHCVSKMARNNHLNNEIYIHDLNHYAVGDHNCLSIPFDKLLANGFNTRQTDVRPANSINTAFQLVAVIFQLQSLQQFGGVSATHLDWTMVPYVRKSFRKHFIDGLKYLETENTWNEPDDLSIEDDRYTVYNKAYQYAKDMTTKECYQAVEGMYHNLND